MEKKVFSKGEVVFREGEMGTFFYQIEEGTAGVYLRYGEADQQKLTELKAPQYFGEMAVIEVWPRSATIAAESELHVIEISEKNLDVYFSEQPEKVQELMKQIGGRIRDLTADYNEVKAFIQEKETAGAEKKESLLGRLKKYLEVKRYADKIGEDTQEEIIRQKFSDKGAELPVKAYSKGQIIFREGDEGHYMYAIHTGTVGIYTHYGTPQQNQLTVLYPDTFFGEMGMIEKETRSATAVVEEDETTLECIGPEDLEAIYKKNPAKIYMILSHLSHRLRSLTKDYLKACQKAAEDA